MFLLISRNSAVDMAVKEQGGGRVETGQNRHQERGAEHGDDVLRADFRGARPGQPRQVPTTSPGFSVLPSPWSFHVNRPAIGLDMRLSP